MSGLSSLRRTTVSRGQARLGRANKAHKGVVGVAMDDVHAERAEAAIDNGMAFEGAGDKQGS